MSSFPIDISEQLEKIISPLSLCPNKKIIVGYSGGVDSESLAHALSLFSRKYPAFQCQLLHINHGLSKNDLFWEQHCKERADFYDLPLEICRVKVAQGPRLSIEREARRVRYQAFKERMATGDIILTAHHEDDQLETLLLAIKRGQGPKGLSAMGQIQVFNGDKWQVRPMLQFSRKEIEHYAYFHNLPHVEDESNQDTKFDRNFLRHIIIPQLKERWPSIAGTASRSAKLCAQQEEALNEEVIIRLNSLTRRSVYNNQIGLDLALLAKQTESWRSLLFRGFIKSQNLLMPTQIQLNEIMTQLFTAKDDSKVELKLSHLIIRRFKGMCYAFNAEQEKDDSIAVYEAKKIQLNVKDIKHGHLLKLGKHNVCFEKDTAKTAIRMPKDNDVITIGYLEHFDINSSFSCVPHFRNKSRSFRKLLQELAVPYWERKHIPLMFINSCLASVGNLWVESKFLDENNNGFSLTVLN